MAQPLPPIQRTVAMEAQQEMASRVLSRRRLMPFVQRMNDRYLPGWVHKDICMRLERFSEQVARGESPRLMLLMPPRHGKSELASKNFPAWHLGRYPDHEFIACSYNLSLAMGFSRKVKQLIDDPLYQSVFDTRLDSNNQSTEEWGIGGHRGGYVAAGIGGPITGKGAHCLAPGTMVRTSVGDIAIDKLFGSTAAPPAVTPFGPRRILAVTQRRAPAEMFRLKFADGRELLATGEHPVYDVTTRKYLTAKNIYTSQQKVRASQIGMKGVWAMQRPAVSATEFERGLGAPAVGQLQQVGDMLLRAPVFQRILPMEHPSLPDLDLESITQVVEHGLDFVYDLQVEDAGCFFAEGVLVGNCLVIDDPVKNAEEADSGDAREKIWEWYLSTAYTRLAPGGGVLVIQTWWHDDDLAGRLQQMMAKADPDDDDIDQFEVVKYPAIATNDEYLDPATLSIVYDKAPTNGTLLRSKGEALHPARYDLKKLNKIRAMNRKDDGSDGRWWSALYQQNPVPDDGSYFTKDQFRRGQIPHKKLANVYIAFDFAISEKKQNDYTVGSVGLHDSDDRLHVADVIRFRSGDAFFIVESILDLATKWYSPSLVLGFEDGQIYRAISALLMKRMKERRMYPAIEVLKPITDKMARARALQGRMQQGMVSFNSEGEWYDVVRAEMLRFPAGVHDDCVDSLAWMTTLAVNKAPPRAPQTGNEQKSWRDRLKGISTGGSTHMCA